MSATSGNCSAGWFCTGNSYMSMPITTGNATSASECSCPAANYTGGKCWSGTYCPSGSPYPVPCKGGMYCRDDGLAEPNGLCDAGYYCDSNATQPDPAHRVCPQGYYCEQGSKTPTPCPAGTLSDTSGNPNVTLCGACPARYYCEGTGNTNWTGPCAPQYYCPAGQAMATPAGKVLNYCGTVRPHLSEQLGNH